MKRTASPCAPVTGVAAWSPNGKRIAYVGARRPIPYLGSGVSPLRAVCVADADGRHAQPLRYTVCRTPCRLDLIDSPSQLDWVRPDGLGYRRRPATAQALRQRAALVAHRRQDRMPRCAAEVLGAGARLAAGRCEHHARLARRAGRLRLVAERQTDRDPLRASLRLQTGGRRRQDRNDATTHGRCRLGRLVAQLATTAGHRIIGSIPRLHATVARPG